MKITWQAVAAALLALAAFGAAAEDSRRGGKWEFTISPFYTDSESVSNTGGSKADIDGAFGFGLGFAYNLSENFSLGFDFAWSQADYKATITPAPGNAGGPYSLSGTLESSTLRLNATWNILARAFTPFVTGGVGATYVDTNVPNGPPSTVCWYDPWWGYYGGTSVPTKSETDLSYMVGAGVRWDSPGTFFLRGMVARQWLDVGGSVGTPSADQIRVDFGFRFR